MKKVLALFLALVLVLSLVACGSGGEGDNGKEEPKESKETKEDIVEKYGLRHISVGDTIHFGTYEQDNNTANGKEEIEWIVLKKDGDSLLVVSRYVLDYRQFNPQNPSTWDISSLRSWLNDDFINIAFTEGEKGMVENSNVKAERNDRDYNNTTGDTSPGSDTRDKVFILSTSEINQYFPTDSARKCEATAYAVKQGAVNFMGGTDWWARSLGINTNFATEVGSDGIIYMDSVKSDHGVRPAMWIDLAP